MEDRSFSDMDTKRKATLRQVVMCLVANLPTVAGGLTLGFSAVAKPYMTSPNPTLYITEQQASFMASVVSLSIPVGSLMAGVVMEGLGRKWALLLSCVPSTAGWLSMAAFPSYEGLLVARLLTGLATGLCCHPATVLMAESATAGLRGLLINGTNLGFSLGILAVYSLGLIFQDNWRAVAVCCGAAAAMAGVAVAGCARESPVWLAGRGQTSRALDSLAWLRASAPSERSVTSELARVLQSHHRGQHLSAAQVLKSFSRPESYKPLIIMLLFFLFQQTTGTFVFIFFGVDIVVEVGINTNPFLMTALLGVANSVFVVVAAWASTRFGRRPCAVVSGLGMTLSLGLLVLYFHMVVPAKTPSSPDMEVARTVVGGAVENLTLTDIPSDSVHPYSWVPAAAILSFIMAATIGFLSLPWAMLGEVFPVAIRGVACGICTCFAYLVSFAVVVAYHPMLRLLGKETLFSLYGAVCLLATAFVFGFLPETQNKTLAQIEQFFSGKNEKQETPEKVPLK